MTSLRQGAAPIVSVVIPAYNYAGYLPDAIGSVLGQTFGDLELIVMDNCSTDDTPAVVSAFEARDARVRYVRNESNIGAVPNFNKGISLARGEYIKIVCADDYLEPACLEKQVAILRDRPDVALVACARQVVSAEKERLEILAYPGRREIVPGPEAIRTCLFLGNRIGEPVACLFRREAARRGFLPEYRQLVDLELWFHLLEKGGFGFDPEPLCSVRRHEKQTSYRNLTSLAGTFEPFRLYRAYGRKDSLRLSPLQRMELMVRFLYHAFYPVAEHLFATGRRHSGKK